MWLLKPEAPQIVFAFVFGFPDFTFAAYLHTTTAVPTTKLVLIASH